MHKIVTNMTYDISGIYNHANEQYTYHIYTYIYNLSHKLPFKTCDRTIYIYNKILSDYTMCTRVN